MRKLHKIAKPNILAVHGEKWTENYVAAVNSGDKKRETNAEKWRHRDIKKSLAEETAKRCAYCESEIDHVAWPHVEHIVPKKKFPELAHDWQNLTSACEKCNNSKDDYYDASGEFALINPYVDNPADHVYFFGSLALAPAESPRGDLTIMRLDLNRSDLTLRRAEHLEELSKAILRWQLMKNPVAKDALRKFIEDSIERGEYSSASRTLFEMYGLKSDA